LGYIGRLVEEKGLLDLLDAMRLCPPTVRLLFVGEGPLQPELERRIAAYGLTPRVEFRAAMPHARLAHVLSSLDALALVSRTTPRWKEQFGRVIIEAHACAIPVIGSCSGAIPDVIGKGGLVVPEADPTAIAQAIKRLHAAPQLAAQLGCAGFEQVQAHYTWQQVAARMHSIYSRMLDSSSPAHNLYA
jgi:glycosyltransferase involved in cell wall biosynthesis